MPSSSHLSLEASGWTRLRNRLNDLAKMRGEWAGLPMPLEGERLIVEPRYPFAEGLMAIGRQADEQDIDPDLRDAKVRNSFYSTRRRCQITIFETTDGRVDWGLEPAFHHITMDLQTLGCAEAWGMEQETAALELLSTLIDPRRFKQYLLTGSFIETSRRSGVVYMFRRLKPTVAIRSEDSVRVMCALCMHPIAYYARSWAGAMCPTDDVVAHLMLMRGDEAMFWRRSTQHPSWRPEAGL